MSVRSILFGLTLLVLSGCDDPVAVPSPLAQLNGEWVVAVDIDRGYGLRCVGAGNFIIRPNEAGEIAIENDLRENCEIQPGELTGVAFSDSIGAFSFATPNCSVSGRFVGADSAAGSISCTPSYYSSNALIGTWSAGRAGPVTSLMISPETSAVVVTGAVDLEAIVRDDKGRRLYGRAPSWSIPNDFSAWLTPNGGRVTVHGNSAHAARVHATYRGLEANATVNFAAQRYTQITAGFGLTCALTESGEAWCWGSNRFGQLGNGTRAPAVGPVRVSGGLQFSSIDAGDHHVCGVSGTSIYCWGNNHYGELGVGDTTARLVPTRVVGTQTWVQVNAGSGRTCAADTQQRAWCWGQDGVPVPPSYQYAPNPTPLRVPGEGSFTRVYAGSTHSCGLTASGAGYCWGQNYAGVLGTGGATSDSVPRPIAGNIMFASLAAGSVRMCGVATSGAAYCWGLRAYGMWTPGADSVIRAPEQVTPGRAYSAISTHGAHICAVDAADSTAWCWGGNNFGEVGSGSVALPNGPVQVYGGLRFTKVAIGGNHSCGIATNSYTYCWGQNASGEVGDGTTADRFAPARVAGQPFSFP